MAADYRSSMRAICTLLFFCLPIAQAFYIPGFSIKTYSEGDPIPLFVNKVYSDNTEIQYAYSELPFVCPPTRRHNPGGLISGSNVALNLGEVLRGDRIMVSDYELEMGKDDEARYLCSQKVNRADLKKAIEVVKQGYVAEWIVDNLPGATSFVTVDKSRKYYAPGFKVGYEETSWTTGRPRYFLNNHVTLVIRYRQAPGRAGQRGKKVILGFEVYAKSIEAENRDASGLPPDLRSKHRPLELTMARNVTNSTLSGSSESSFHLEMLDDGAEDAVLTIPYTYSVYFREDDKTSWENRWDPYFVNQEESTGVHWVAIVNSLTIFGLLTSVVAVIFTRMVRGDIKQGILEEGKSRGKRRGLKSPRRSGEKTGGLLEQPGDVDTIDLSDEEVIEEVTGWKLVHADVFRSPANGYLLAPLIGSGMQLIFMAVGLITLSCFGVLNPSFRGGFISVGMALFLLAGIFSGYFSARVYKTFGGLNWKYNAVVTATLVPGLMFATIFILNLFVWAQASSTAIPLGTLFGLAALWLFVQLPLVYGGSYYGFWRSGAYTHPIKAGSVARQIPIQPWYARPVQLALAAGLIPFAVIFIELLFVFHSLWSQKTGYYYIFGYLAVVSTILLLAVMETTIIAVYIQLCSENYHWWWQSFFLGAASAAWIFAYSVYYYVHALHLTGFVSNLLFFAYTLLACSIYGLLMGTVGFLTAYAFVRRIYSAIKVD
ncbi:endomembrane protein 70 [Neohortaea acidophila]|uniref:Transmembrane 9 superfamily member n=1 Tax=Neohortaea acidophila TaxID=245834 RepID=A0A6A6PVQ7_9PEZI|nr:endomembrane protein 70 [Neohortaea acidophila]KAF2483563.1 endomembrane protein 70 [Neohortaea acidophila]